MSFSLFSSSSACSSLSYSFFFLLRSSFSHVFIGPPGISILLLVPPQDSTVFRHSFVSTLPSGAYSVPILASVPPPLPLVSRTFSCPKACADPSCLFFSVISNVSSSAGSPLSSFALQLVSVFVLLPLSPSARLLSFCLLSILHQSHQRLQQWQPHYNYSTAAPAEGWFSCIFAVQCRCFCFLFAASLFSFLASTAVEVAASSLGSTAS